MCSNLRSRRAQKQAYVFISCPLVLSDFNQMWNMLAKLAIPNLMQVPSVVMQFLHTGSQEDKAERVALFLQHSLLTFQNGMQGN